MKILGIDEAGRGAVVGPLVIAGAMFEENDIGKLRALGVRDSKELTKNKREFLEEKIMEIAKDFVVVRISAKKIDELREEKNLNRIEIDHFCDIIKAMMPDKAIVDSPEVNTEKIKNEILGKLGDLKVEVISENYADKKYPVVSAASILAKVVRDKSIEALENEIGEKIGKGYPSDERTINFLNKILDKEKKYPDYIRKSWITSKRLLSERAQRKLDHFIKDNSGN